MKYTIRSMEEFDEFIEDNMSITLRSLRNILKDQSIPAIDVNPDLEGSNDSDRNGSKEACSAVGDNSASKSEKKCDDVKSDDEDEPMTKECSEEDGVANETSQLCDVSKPIPPLSDLEIDGKTMDTMEDHIDDIQDIKDEKDIKEHDIDNEKDTENTIHEKDIKIETLENNSTDLSDQITDNKESDNADKTENLEKNKEDLEIEAITDKKEDSSAIEMDIQTNDDSIHLNTSNKEITSEKEALVEHETNIDSVNEADENESIANDEPSKTEDPSNDFDEEVDDMADTQHSDEEPSLSADDLSNDSPERNAGVTSTASLNLSNGADEDITNEQSPTKQDRKNDADSEPTVSPTPEVGDGCNSSEITVETVDAEFVDENQVIGEITEAQIVKSEDNIEGVSILEFNQDQKYKGSC